MELYEPTAIKYIDGVLRSFPGPKALLVDEATRQLLSVTYTQSALLEHEVFLVDLVNKIDRPKHLKYLGCVILCRPTSDVINAISTEVSRPCFNKYHITFANLVEKQQLEFIVNADVHHLVEHVDEVFLDAHPVTNSTGVVALGGAANGFRAMQQQSLTPQGTMATTTLANLVRSKAVNPMSLVQSSNDELLRMTQGIVGMMLASKRRPAVRYSANSKLAARVAGDVGAKMQSIHTTFFDLRHKDSLLLIVDRAEDPITPLLTQWTYEAMMHELITDGIQNGIVDLSEGDAKPATTTGADDDKKKGEDEKRFVVNARTDAFFNANRDANYGDLCTAVKDLVEAYKQLNNIDLQTASIADLREFAARVPDAKKQSTLVFRHATIVGALGDQVKQRHLQDISLCEQEIIEKENDIGGNPNDHARRVMELLSDKQYNPNDLLRLVAIYALRYEKSPKGVANLEKMKDLLAQQGVPEAKINFIRKLLEYGGQSERANGEGLFTKPAWQSKGMLRSLVQQVKAFSNDESASNVLTQHKPHLYELICAAYNGVLPIEEYPFAEVPGTHHRRVMIDSARPKDILVFVIGGATYEEARLVTEINDGKMANLHPPQTAAATANAAATNSESSAWKDMTGKFRRLGMGGGDDAAEEGGNAGGGSSSALPDTSSIPFTEKLDCKVFLGAPTMLNSTTFMASLQ